MGKGEKEERSSPPSYSRLSWSGMGKVLPNCLVSVHLSRASREITVGFAFRSLWESEAPIGTPAAHFWESEAPMRVWAAHLPFPPLASEL